MLCISSVVHGVTVPKPAGHDGRALALRRSSRGPGGRRRAIHLPTQTGHHKSQQLKAWSPEGSTSPSIHARVIGLQADPMPKIIFKTRAGLYVSASYTLGIDSKMATSLILFPNKARARSLSLSHPGPGPRRRAGSLSLSRGSGSVTPPSCQWARPAAGPGRRVFGLWRVRFPPVLVRTGRRLPVQALGERRVLVSLTFFLTGYPAPWVPL